MLDKQWRFGAPANWTKWAGLGGGWVMIVGGWRASGHCPLEEVGAVRFAVRSAVRPMAEEMRVCGAENARAAEAARRTRGQEVQSSLGEEVRGRGGQRTGKHIGTDVDPGDAGAWGAAGFGRSAGSELVLEEGLG